jgi:Protein of unknown function (DUF1460)
MYLVRWRRLALVARFCWVALALGLGLRGGAWAEPAQASSQVDGSGLKPFVRLSSQDEVTQQLRLLTERFPAYHQRLQAIVRLRAETPYMLGCLGEECPPDVDPVFRVDQVDCTVLVLTSMALAHARSWDEARDWTVRLNYRAAPDGTHAICYTNREHFTEERLAHSPWFSDITAGLGCPTQRLVVHLNRRKDGRKLLDLPFDKQVEVRYLACADVNEAVLRRLPAEICGIAFVRRAHLDDGVAIAHEGFVDSQRWLVHADSRARQVRRLPLLSYLDQNRHWFDGVIFYACH